MNDDIKNDLGDAYPDSTDQPTDAMSEVELDAVITRFGGDYNRPTDFVPREEMWHEIQRGSQRRTRKWPSISLIAAAVVLLAAGIGIGVQLHSRGLVGSTVPARQAVASNTALPQQFPTASSGNNAEAIGATLPVAQHIRSGAAGTAPRTAPRTTTTGDYASSSIVGAPGEDARSTAYSLATVRHFTAVEALLTSYQTTQRDASNDAQLAAWARSLLTQTRLLLDSPAATDPVRNKLLQDLELILVQMTQLSPANTSIDRESLDGSMQHSAVIPRLRTAVPAGASTTL